jgi:hypothetical protein
MVSKGVMIMNKFQMATLALATSAIVLTGCVHPNGEANNTANGALIGAGSGAAFGAALGAIGGGGRGAAAGALLGGAFGAITGTIIGNQIDQEQAAELQEEYPATYPASNRTSRSQSPTWKRWPTQKSAMMSSLHRFKPPIRSIIWAPRTSLICATPASATEWSIT